MAHLKIRIIIYCIKSHQNIIRTYRSNHSVRQVPKVSGTWNICIGCRLIKLTNFSFCFQISLRIFWRSADEVTRRCEQSARLRDRSTYVFANEETCILIFSIVVENLSPFEKIPSINISITEETCVSCLNM